MNFRAGVFRIRPRSGAGGFTLLEVILALAVAGVAAAAFMSFYVTSMDLTRTAASRTVASGFAQDMLNTIARDPGNFYWALPEPDDDSPFRVGLEEEDPAAGNRFPLPGAMPIDQRAHRAQEAFHERYRWTAFGRLPAPDAEHYEVSVVVRWVQAGRQESVVLTSAVPRFAVEERS